MELKFRAWDGYNIRYDITWFEHWHRSSNEMKWIFIKWEYYEIKTTPVMQYTWIKDRNWKEIYEGDLIQYDWNSRVWEVYFDEDRLQYRIRCTWKDWFVSSYSMDWLDCYVVWNIYENSDLINN